ncbi:MAG: FG-GAP-like repeat-containing protein [Melioribacteraceae bacterium]
MKTYKTLLLIISILLVHNINSYGQATILQTLTENLENSASNFGKSVSSAGDVNNDGYDDVIVTGNDSLIYIYFGGEAIDDTADVILVSNSFGSAASAGDVNNDGYDDIIVSGTHFVFFYGYKGGAGIFFGGEQMDTEVDVMFSEKSSFLGVSLAGAGDLNNDGFDDVIVGAGGNSLDQGAYIYFGGTTMDNEVDLELTETVANSFFGASVSTAGDVNNDGFDDVIVGSHRFDNSKGRSLVYFGGLTMKDSADVVLEGKESTENFGWSVSTAGDVNNDGYDDIIIGAKAYTRSTGRAYIYYGGATVADTATIILTGEKSRSEFGVSVSSVGDINFDGYDDVIVGAGGYVTATGRAYVFLGDSTMNNSADVIITGRTTNNFFGNSVSGNLDVNNDGVNDILVGAYKNKEAFVYTIFNPTSLEEVEITNLDFKLFQNYPNPFNPTTKINFSLSEATRVSITIYNSIGQQVKELINKDFSAGVQSVDFNASNLSSGIYFYRIHASGYSTTKKMLLLR